MRTTLKRGTAGHVAGNGHGGIPISPLTGVTRYRTKRRGPLRLVGKFFLWLVMIVLVAAGALAGGAWLYINQSVAAVRAHSAPVKEAQIELTEATPVTLSLNEAAPALELTATLAELGVRVDQEVTLRRARAVGRRGSPITRQTEIARARAGDIDVPIEIRFERRVFFEHLGALKRELDRGARPARYPFAGHALVPDVPGRALRALVINKLPFKVPSEPLTAARLERLAEEGQDGFVHYLLPHAALKLKQGFGRLIRSRKDLGVVVLLTCRTRATN